MTIFGGSSVRNPEAAILFGPEGVYSRYLRNFRTLTNRRLILIIWLRRPAEEIYASNNSDRGQRVMEIEIELSCGMRLDLLIPDEAKRPKTQKTKFGKV